MPSLNENESARKASFQYSNGFRDYIATTLGTRKWVVAPRLTKSLKGRGYELAVSRKKFTGLRQAYLGQIEREPGAK
jgi:hypothetical protein